MDEMMSVLQAISDQYISIHILDIEHNRIRVLKTNQEISKWSEIEGSVEFALKNVMEHRCAPHSMKGMMDFIDFATLEDRLLDRTSISFDFEGIDRVWCRAVFMKLEEVPITSRMVFTVEDISDAVEKQLSGERILSALANDYTSVYNVNTLTRKVTIVKIYGAIQSVMGGSDSGIDYGEAIRASIEFNVSPDYRPEMYDLLDLDHLLGTLENQQTITKIFLNTQNKYEEMKIVRSGEHSMIFGFADKDQENRLAIRRKAERENERAALEKVISALAYEYTTVLTVDIPTEKMTIYKMTERVAQTVGKLFRNKKYTEAMSTYFEVGVLEEDREAIREESKLSHLKEVLKWPDSMTLVYRNILGAYGEEKIVRIDEDTLIIGFANKDREIRAEMERKRELEAALVRANDASQAKSDFLSNMSHDIRTPMNAIVGYTDLAIRHDSDQKMVADSLHKISKASEQMLDLINDILDMSRIESGKLEVSPEPTSLIAGMDNLRSIFAAQAREKQIELKMDTSQVKHPTVLCDRKLTDRVVMNLMSNAIKFTKDKGTVAVRLEEFDSADPKGATYRVTVADNGIGMSPEFVKQIFEPFTRAQTATASGIQGTGLGMAIVSNIVKLLGGKIQIKSEPGKGSMFMVDLPFEFIEEEPVNTKQMEAMLQKSFDSKRVLLVEDMLVNRELAKVILEEQKIRVEVAEDGQQAVDLFAANPDRFDAILMDVQMPIMDGYEATKAIRLIDTPRAKTIPIIAMTANAFVEDKQRAMEAGMDDHIAKPIDVNQMNRTLSKYLR